MAELEEAERNAAPPRGRDNKSENTEDLKDTTKISKEQTVGSKNTEPRIYIPLPARKAAWIFPVRLRRSHLQKIARDRKDDPSFPWAELSRLLVNESLFLPPGYYFASGRRETWAAANAATALCYGKNAPFTTLDEVPPDILAQCEEGAAKDLAAAGGRRIIYSGRYLGTALGLTPEDRDRLKIWQISPAGWTEADLDARRRQKDRERRERNKPVDRDRKEAMRRKNGCKTVDEIVLTANLREVAKKIAGISESTFKRRSKEQQKALLDAARHHLLGNSKAELSASAPQCINNTIASDAHSSSKPKPFPKTLNGERAPYMARTPAPYPHRKNIIVIIRHPDGHHQVVRPQ